MSGSPAIAFRPSARARARIALGVLLALVSVGAVLLVLATVDKRVPVLQLVRDVPAGGRISDEDVRVVEIAADPSVQLVDADLQSFVVGRYAKVRLVAGALLTMPALQDGPLVADGHAIVALVVAPGELPSGLRERSHVRVVFAEQTASAPVEPTTTDGLVPTTSIDSVEGWIVGLPSQPDTVAGSVSVSIELSDTDAIVFARRADGARVVLLDPAHDPALPTVTTTDVTP